MSSNLLRSPPPGRPIRPMSPTRSGPLSSPTSSCCPKRGAAALCAVRGLQQPALHHVGGSWRMMPHDVPPWQVVYQWACRWMVAGCFEPIVAELHVLLQCAAQR